MLNNKVGTSNMSLTGSVFGAAASKKASFVIGEESSATISNQKDED
jgi:hypothetical protein